MSDLTTVFGDIETTVEIAGRCLQQVGAAWKQVLRFAEQCLAVSLRVFNTKLSHTYRL